MCAKKCLLEEGKSAFSRYELSRSRILSRGKDIILFPWIGDRSMSTLIVQLNAVGLRAASEGVAIVVADSSEREVRHHLQTLVSKGPISPVSLAATIPNKLNQKNHIWLNQYSLHVGALQLNNSV